MTQWYYSDYERNRLGPVSASALAELHANAQLQPDTPVWREGMAQWQPWQSMMNEVLSGPAAMGAAGTSPGAGAASYAVAAEPHSPYTPPTAVLADSAGYLAGGEVVYAGFWKRAAAYAIDAFVVGIATWIVQMVVMGMLFGISAGAMTTGDPSAFMAGGVMAMLVGMIVVPILLQMVYYAAFHASSRQATLGKMAIGIKVTDDQGHRISFARGVGRYFATILSSLILLVGYIMAGFTERKRALHDMIASTLVVDQWAYTAHPERQRRELGTVTIVILVIGGLLALGYFALIAIIAIMAASGAGNA
jgi:uncharacterized RDD family membrane protein YckC